MKKIVRKNYEYRKGPKVTFETESRTKQAFKDECDINLIVRRARAAGGFLPDMIRANPRYGDFSDVPTYQEAHEIVARSHDQFFALSAEVRDRFQNDPARFLAFATDRKNHKEMVELGLATPKAPKAPHEPKQEPPKEVPPQKPDA